MGTVRPEAIWNVPLIWLSPEGGMYVESFFTAIRFVWHGASG